MSGERRSEGGARYSIAQYTRATQLARSRARLALSHSFNCRYRLKNHSRHTFSSRIGLPLKDNTSVQCDVKENS